MRFALVDPDGTGLSWASRLQDEGHEVLYYLHERKTRDTGVGIVPKTNSLFELLQWAKTKPTIGVFLFTGMGKRSPKVPLGVEEFENAGVPCIMGGVLMDRLENDREFGMKVASKIGVRQPPTFHFSSATQAQTFLKGQKDKEWYFKPNDMSDCDTTYGGKGSELVDYLGFFREQFGDNRANIVQMKIPGIAISTAAWFNGHTFLEPVEGTIERKKFMTGEIGPSTGCAINVVWMYPERPKLFEDLKFRELAPILAAKKCQPGLIDINAIIAEESGPWGPAKVPYFLEWTPRCGWDSEAVSMRLAPNLGEFLTGLAQRKLSKVPHSTDKLGYGVRLSLSPYPYVSKMKEELRPSPKGKPVRGFASVWREGLIGYDLMKGKDGYAVSTDSPCIGVAVAFGSKLSALEEQAIKFTKTLQPSGIQYRTDGAKVLGEDAKRVKALGYDLPQGIME